jgi:hypothetical protein
LLHPDYELVAKSKPKLRFNNQESSDIEWAQYFLEPDHRLPARLLLLLCPRARDLGQAGESLPKWVQADAAPPGAY